jgi:GNAT superfamily N-acetyltransferase
LPDSLRIEKAHTLRDLRTVILFPWQLYRHDPLWVPPIVADRLARFDPASNPMLRHGEAQAFIARRGNQVVGTIAAAVDHELNSLVGDKVYASLGFFECVNDATVAEVLVSAACDWARARNVSALRGPYNLTPNDDPGLLVEGHDRPPPILCAHTLPYYLDLFERLGFRRWGPDLLCYGISIADYHADINNLPRKLLHVVEAVRKRSRASVRSVRLDDWDNEIEMARVIYNKSLAVLPGFSPLSAQEFRRLARAFKPLVDPDLALFVQVSSQPVGFVLAFPEINSALIHCNGLRYPWDYARLWRHARRVRSVSFKILALDPDYWSRGLDALMYVELAKATFRKGYTWMDMSVTGEDNPQTNKLATLVGARVYKRYRIFELAI